jgi:MFS family permease
MRNSNKDYLWLIFFLIIFINGFEAGGYQASLLSIGKSYDLSTTSKGIFASIELFATMLAPLFLGAWADRNIKLKCIRILLFIQLFFSALVLLVTSRIIFALGIFFLGLTTSALQFISIAALAEVYPNSSKRKIGFMTSMYAFGAFIAPLIVSAYLKMGFGWRTLFLLLTITSTIALIGLLRSADGTREKIDNIDIDDATTGTFIFGAILLLCIIMCIYVGYENGFAFFIDTLFAEELGSGIGKYALSIFWIIMIPSRVMAGYLGKYSHKILTSAIIAIPVITIIISRLNTDIPVLLLCIPLGFACGAIYPSVLNIAMPLAGNHKATATGMITTATGIGGVVFTALTGIIGDRWGLRTAILILSAFFAISLISVLLLNQYSHNTEST